MTVHFKKFPRRLALVAGLSMVCASGAFAQSSSTVATAASATIVRPIVLTKVTDLVFGNLVADATAVGTAILDNADGLTVGGAATIPGTQGGVHTSASFTLTGEGAFTYSLTLPASVTITDGTNTMLVDGFTNSLTSSAGTLSGSNGASGSGAFKVGATLHVGIAQVPNAYTANFNVTVQYN